MASKKLSLANLVKTYLEGNVNLPEITSSNTLLVIGGVLSQEMLNQNGLTIVISPLERVMNVTQDRCSPRYVYQVGIALFQKLTTQDLTYLSNAASESELTTVDELSETVEDELYNVSHGDYSFSGLETDTQLDPAAMDHGFFRHTLMVTYIGD